MPERSCTMAALNLRMYNFSSGDCFQLSDGYLKDIIEWLYGLLRKQKTENIPSS